MAIKKVVVCGGGVLGSQIAFQAQYCGFDSTIWLRSEASIERTRPKLEKVKQAYEAALNKYAKTHAAQDYVAGLIPDVENFDLEESLKKVELAAQNLTIELDMGRALQDADIVIESMSEDLKLKRAFFTKLSDYLEDKTIVCTNSSSLLPSKMMNAVKHPERFCALHFANDIYKCNTAEVMMTPKTSIEVFNQVVEFAAQINMVPLKLTKEKDGYLLNSMLIPLLMSGFDLYANGISTPRDIDKAWTIGTGAALGPFEMLDIIGMKTVYDVTSKYAKLPNFMTPYNFKAQCKILKKMMDEGRMGKMCGKGFYNYDAEGNKLND